MPPVQMSHGDRDPNEKACRTCMYWDGDRSWPTDESLTGACSLSSERFPPFFSKVLEAAGVEPVTKATDSCQFHEYRPSRL